jgi:4-aminobutyrate aminotransferase-like enzyme
VAKYLADVDEGVARLVGSGYRPAALMLDSVWDAPGPLSPPAEYVRGLCERVRQAGGLVIADEVQAGHCRTGEWWGFGEYDLVPDIVTLGKPAGNGHPLAVVVTTPDVARSFASRGSYFNTFGGNPVSTAAGLAVLDVMEEEKLGIHVKDCAKYLRKSLQQMAREYPMIGAVKGRGMFLGLDLVTDPETREPVSAETLRGITTRLLHEGILAGSTGRHENVLKLRPPLPFNRCHADQVVDALRRVFSSIPQRQGTGPQNAPADAT